MAKGANSSLRGTYGGGGWYCASVNDQIRPTRESFVSSNSSPAHAGLRQKNDALGKNTVPQVVHRLPSRAGSPVVGDQPAIAGRRVSDTASDYTPAMPPIVPPGRLVYGIQLPVQAQSKSFVEPWEITAGPAEVARGAPGGDPTR